MAVLYRNDLKNRYTVRIKRNPTFLTFCSKTKPREYGMGRREENSDFVCMVCQKQVVAIERCGYRNHCPFCLSSLHLDGLVPGDRKSSCRGVMRASRLKHSGRKGWQIVHQCVKCGHERSNLIAEDDDWEEVVKLSRVISQSRRGGERP